MIKENVMEKDDFIAETIKTARSFGYNVEISRSGLRQVDFGNKKLHENHLKQLFPEILLQDAHIPTMINGVAPGRPCTHKPMRMIIQKILRGQQG